MKNRIIRKKIKELYPNIEGQTPLRKGRRHNITYTQAGVSCFVGQISSKIEVQFFVGGSVVESPACV